MFGALNRFISRLDSEPQDGGSGAHGNHGFQVLRNSNLELPIEPWFDFIIGINGRVLDNSDPNLFAAEIRNAAGSTINLGVWSAKGQRIRELYVPVPQEPPSLGLALQWAPLSVTEDVWHILDVIPNSPADVAGLLPYGDYIIGSPEGIVRGEAGLGELVEDFLDRPLRLHVYNHEYAVTRPVTITPSRSWGGTGALGCVLGFGALHRIPAPLEEPPQAPGETLFDTAPPAVSSPLENASQFSPAETTSGAQGPPQPTEFLVPANIQFEKPAQTAPGPPKAGRKARAQHHHVSPASAMDEYLKEGEQKSMEEDFTSKKPASGSLPPPPKAGGPPRTTKSPGAEA